MFVFARLVEKVSSRSENPAFRRKVRIQHSSRNFKWGVVVLPSCPKVGLHAIDSNAAGRTSLACVWTEQGDGTILVMHAA